MQEQSNRDAAVALALERLHQELADLPAAELAARCELHEMGVPEDGAVDLRFLDRRFRLDLVERSCTPDIDPLSKALSLRLLTRATPLSRGQTPLAYRELPGASFYVGPFRSRTVQPLAAKIGDDIDRLEQALQRFEPQAIQASADAAWRIPACGRIWLELHYWEPDEEFPANCELLFAPAVAEAYTADEAAMLGSLLVWGLRV